MDAIKVAHMMSGPEDKSGKITDEDLTRQIVSEAYDSLINSGLSPTEAVRQLSSELPENTKPFINDIMDSHDIRLESELEQ